MKQQFTKNKSGNHKQQHNGERPPRFTEQDKDRVEDLLHKVVAIRNDIGDDIGWEWDSEDILVVDGLIGDEQTRFSNWRTAVAGLEMYLAGYDAGYGAGRRE